MTTRSSSRRSARWSSADTQAKIEAQKKAFVDGGSPFTGPIVAQDGNVKIPAGTTPDYAAIEQMDYLVEGVVGTLPS